MAGSPHSKVSGRLPGFSNWVPGQDRGSVGEDIIEPTGEEEEDTDAGEILAERGRRRAKGAGRVPPPVKDAPSAGGGRRPGAPIVLTSGMPLMMS